MRASDVAALVRWPNAAIAALGVLLGAWWAGGPVPARGPILASLAAVALTAVANAYNDLHDRAIDRTAHPERPLARGTLRPRDALAVTAIAALLGIALAAAARPALGALSVAVVGLMLLYSVRLKARGLPGNLTVAVLASLPFLYGAWSVGRPRAALPLLALAIPLHLAREIAKDLEDAAADAPVRRTLPVTLGARGARAACLAALAAFGIAAALFALGRPMFALFALPAFILCALAARRAVQGRAGAPQLLKLAMLLAMASLLPLRQL